MRKSIVGAFFLFIITTALSATAMAQTDEHPEGYDPGIRFDYSQIDNILEQTVFRNGMSDRKPARRPKPDVGTSIVRGNTSITRFEANRVLYHMMTKEGIEYAALLRDAIARLPEQVPLNILHTDEQLAYWLNLRNLIVFEALADDYPLPKLEKFWKRLYKKKVVRVEGKRMSVADIEAYIKENWPSPYVMYGFYNGAVGGPNLRLKAFTRDNVWKSLKGNGRDFVGSLRGLQFDGDVARVSELYETHTDLFPNFQSDLRAHLLELAYSDLDARIHETSSIRADVNDWYIADLYGGSYSKGSAAMVGPAALLSAFGPEGGIGGTTSSIATGTADETGIPLGDQHGVLETGMRNLALQGHPARVQEFMENWYRRNSTREGVVYIDEVENSGEDEEDQPDQ